MKQKKANNELSLTKTCKRLNKFVHEMTICKSKEILPISSPASAPLIYNKDQKCILPRVP